VSPIELHPGDVAVAEANARAACMGGVSRIRGDDRMATLGEDQIVGQLGQIALHRYWFGHLHLYAVSRWHANQNPELGDKGHDIPGANVDVKASVMRRSQDPMTYNLCVRPRERHDGWVYVLALVPPNWRDSLEVYLVGWAQDQDLPALTVSEGPLSGTYALPATYLRELPPVRFRLLPEAA
jgi:hypothetical protein